MKKLLISILFLLAIPASGLTLYEYYIQRLGYYPSAKERAGDFERFSSEKYERTAEQNQHLLSFLMEEEKSAEIILGGFNSGQTFRGGGFVDNTAAFNDASTTIFAFQNPFANATSTAFVTITGTNGTTTIDILVGTSTSAYAPLNGNLPSPTLINATTIATSTQFTSHSGVSLGSDKGYTSPGASSQYRISVAPSAYILGQATSSYAGSSATGLQGILGGANTFTGNVFVTWHR